MRPLHTLIALLLPALGLNAEVIINEFLASNQATVTDEDQDYPDYIELFNNGGQPVALQGYFLTDDVENLTKWEIPSVTIGAGEYLLIFASGKDRSNPAANLHTSFSLSRGGEYLALVASDGVTVLDAFQPTYPEQYEDVSFGTWAGDGSTVTFLQPSPGTANNSLYEMVATPEFSVEHGFYDTAFTLQVSSASPGAAIYYTTDGSVPTTSNGTLYNAQTGIQISDTTVLRAAAFISGFPSSKVATASYIFLESAVTQTNSQGSRGFPSMWIISRSDYTRDRKTRVADYQMDPAIPIQPSDLTTVPSISIVIPQEDLWDSYTGIYVNSHKDAASDSFWERACSVEYIDPSSDETFTADTGVRIFGGAASHPDLSDKMGFRFVFRGDYGPGRLNSNMFDRVGPGADELNTIVLRSHWGSSFLRNPQLSGWAGQTEPWEACYMRDVYANECYRATGHLNVRSMMVHVYLNGLYWGLYEAMERPDDSFNSENRGGSDSDYDVIRGEEAFKTQNGAVHSGNATNYRKLFSYFDTGPTGYNLSTVTPISDSDLVEVGKYLDLPAFTDHMITLWILNRLDFPNKNWYGASKRGAVGQPPEQPFVFFTWDSEATLWFDSSFNRKISWNERSVAERWNILSDRDYCQIRLYRRLKLNEQYQRMWADRAYMHMFNGGVLSREALIARWDNLAAELDLAIHGELARWGDWVPLYANNPVTKADWLKEVGLVRDHVIADRVDLVIEQMREFNIYPDMDPPLVENESDVIWPGEMVSLNAQGQSGSIRYSLDGSDPRDTGSTYSAAIGIDKPVLLRAAMVDGNDWSAAVQRHLVPLGGLPLAITEIMYNPAPTLGVEPGLEAGLEFIEVTNVGEATVSLADVALTNGVDFAFAGGAITELAAGASVLVVRDLALFEQVYGSSRPVAGEFSGNLDNGGETVELSVFDYVIQKFRYNDGASWPALADGGGRSLEARGVEMDGSLGAAWTASSLIGGTPGSWNAQATTSDPWAAGSSKHGLKWRNHPVFGTYFVTGTPVLFNEDHGWMYVLGDENASWCYDYQLGWLFTRAEWYPYLWSVDQQDWLYYRRDASGNAMYFDYGDQVWLTE